MAYFLSLISYRLFLIQSLSAFAADSHPARLAAGCFGDVMPDPRRSALRAQDHDVRNRDGRFLFRNAARNLLGGVLARMSLDDVHVLDHNAPDVAVYAQNASFLAAVP